MSSDLKLGIVLEMLWGPHAGPTLTPFRACGRDTFARLAADGFTFVQSSRAAPVAMKHAREAGFEVTSGILWRLVPGAGDLKTQAQRARDQGATRGIILAGWGARIPSVDAAIAAVDEILAVQQATGLPLRLETHRGTISESLPIAVELATRFPDLRWNLDLSHWYVTHRLDRVPRERFLQRAAPVLDRVDYVHARVASAHDIQDTVGPGAAYFEAIWADVRARCAGRGETLYLAPELLSPRVGYAPSPDPRDRYGDALRLSNSMRGKAS